MTPQEQQMIDGLIQRVQNTQLTEKDPEAEQHLQQGLGRNPNTLYILAQTILVQGYALEQAQKQLADAKAALAQAQQQAQEPKHATSFLGSLFGSSDNKPAPPPQSQYAPVPTYSQPQSYPPPPYGQPQVYPQPSYGAPPPQGGGFLRGAMQTAAGVAAGAVAFEGIESLMHGFGGHGGGSSFGSFGGNDAPREEVINNYYGDSSGRDHDSRGLTGNDDGYAGNSDIEDRRDDAASQTDFADTDDTNALDSGDDFASSDESSFDSGDNGDSGDDSSFS